MDAMLTYIKSFLEFLRLNRNLSAHTVRAYESDLSQLVEYVARVKGVKQAELEPASLDRSAMSFLAELHDLEQSRARRAQPAAARTSSGIRREGFIDRDPVLRRHPA
jgi:site-specific recombinase XerD